MLGRVLVKAGILVVTFNTVGRILDESKLIMRRIR
jgi:hypothetical protein